MAEDESKKKNKAFSGLAAWRQAAGHSRPQIKTTSRSPTSPLLYLFLPFTQPNPLLPWCVVVGGVMDSLLGGLEWRWDRVCAVVVCVCGVMWVCDLSSQELQVRRREQAKKARKKCAKKVHESAGPSKKKSKMWVSLQKNRPHLSEPSVLMTLSYIAEKPHRTFGGYCW